MKRTHLISASIAALMLGLSSLSFAGGPHHGGHGYRDHGYVDGYDHRYNHHYGHRYGHRGARHGYRHGYRHGARHGYRHGYRHGHRHGPRCRHAAYPAYRPGVYFRGPLPYPYPRPYRYPGGRVSLYFDF